MSAGGLYESAHTTPNDTGPKGLLRNRPMVSPSRLSANASGAAAIEFAIVLPVFLVLVAGLLAYGLYLGTAHSVAQLAADAARASIAGLSDAERSTLARSFITVNARNYPLIESEKVSVEAGPSSTDPTEFRVAVRYDAGNLPIWQLGGLVPLPNHALVRVSIIKRGGF